MMAENPCYSVMTYIPKFFFLLFLSIALQLFEPWPFFQFLILTQSVVLLGLGISPSQGHYLHVQQYKLRMHTDMYASSGIHIRGPSVRAEDTVHILDRAATVIGHYAPNLS
jgi:hypothetical protein